MSEPCCSENCTRCSGEYCDTHGVAPCECDVEARHTDSNGRWSPEELLAGDPDAPEPRGVLAGQTFMGRPVVEVDGLETQPEHAPFVAFIDGAFGGRRVVIDGDYEKVMREAAASDPRLARELKRRGWLKD